MLDLELLDFEDGYFALRAPRDAELALLALEVWGCGVCLRTQTARLRFEAAGAAGWRLAEVSVAVLSRDVLEAAQFISRRLEELAPNPGDDAAGIRDIVRRISQRLGREPGARAGALPTDYLSENCNPVPSVPEFPLTATLDHGAYRVDLHLLGESRNSGQSLWLGREIATGAQVLVSFDLHSSRRQDAQALRQQLDYHVPGVFELAYLGAFDADPSWRDVDPSNRWATVERVTAGAWLPRVLATADLRTAATAIGLGSSAGRILMTAVAAGVDCTHIRPELMWAERQGGRLVVTGLSPRATELFKRKVTDMFTHPVFDRFYHAPEIHQEPDDRAVAYALAVMVAEWATGKFPFESRWAPPADASAHLPIEAPPPLARLLERTIRGDRNGRPRLAELVESLEQLQ